jgi:hypothetical protein
MESASMYDNQAALEDELLYGSAGYLYCVLLLKHAFPDFRKDKVDFVIRLGVESLFQAGQLEGGLDYLFYRFPRGRTPFMGAAHGSLGIVYMLAKALQAVPSLYESNPELLGWVRRTVDDLAGHQSVRGHFPFTFEDDPQQSEESYPVHFCHGAPGAIPLFIEAHKLFQEPQYLEVAKKCGECVWQYGLIKKGTGLCHGVAGNAYFLMTLFRVTNDEKWK